MAKNDILVFCAHPENFAADAGGTLARHAEEGNKVRVFIYSYGEFSQPQYHKDFLKSRKKKEAKRAGEVLGCHSVEFLEKFNHEKITKVLKKYQPGKVFTHSSVQAHPEYHIVRKAVLESTWEEELYGFQGFIKSRQYPLMVVDVTATFKTKIEALKCFSGHWRRTALSWSRGFLNGLKYNGKYVEIFYRLL